MAKKLCILLAIGLVFGMSACSLMENSSVTEKSNVIITGEPAIDAASIFYSDDELKNLNLYAGGDAESRVIASNTKLSVIVNGPLNDARLIRGKKLAVSALRGSAAPVGETYKVYYGIDASRMYDYKDLVTTGYGNMVAIFDLPYTPTSKRFYYYVVGNKGTTFNNNGIPFSLPIMDSAVSLRLYNNQITLNYSGPAAGDGCYLHSGWNNWSNVSDTGMTYIGYSITKYASPGGYASVVLNVPSWANYSDFVVKKGSLTDNNAGADWHYSLKPLVDVSWTDNSAGKKSVNIYYSAGTLNPPIAHYGINNWLETKDKQLSSTGGGQWASTVAINPNAATVNVCFKDAYGNWNNNFGKNWVFTVN